MYVDACFTVHMSAHDARNDRNAVCKQEMREPVYENRLKSGVGQDDFFRAPCSRVPLQHGLRIELDFAAYFGNFFDERETCLFCELEAVGVFYIIIAAFLLRDSVDERLLDFLGEYGDDVVDSHAGDISDI